MPRRGSPYNVAYERERRLLLSMGRECQLRLVCNGVRANSADHNPPLALHQHRNGSGCCRLIPACLDCQREQGKRVANITRHMEQRPLPTPSRTW